MLARPDSLVKNTLVSLRGVTLNYPIYSVQARSLRGSIVRMAVGGRLMKGRDDVVHVRALENVSFDLQEGDRLAILGHNGSGKTTLLKVIAGIYEQSQGDVSVTGRISSMIEIGNGLEYDVTGRKNIEYLARYRGVSAAEIKDRIDSIAEFSELGSFLDLPISTYSAGMLMRLVFATATEFEPDILVLDEWLGAGDENFSGKAEARMKGLAAKARVVILATHSAKLAQGVCNKICKLDAGKVVYFGPIEDYVFT